MSFWILNSVPLVLYICPYASTTPFDYCSFCLKFWNWEVWVLQLFYFFQDCFSSLRSPDFYVNFSINLSISAKKKKKAVGILRNYIDLLDQFREYCRLNNFVFNSVNMERLPVCLDLQQSFLVIFMWDLHIIISCISEIF